MCESVIKNRAPITLVLSDREITKPDTARKLEISEWSDMENMVSLLKPFQVATTVLCSEKNVTISMVRPIISNIIKKHLAVSPSDDENTKIFKETAVTFLKCRFAMEDNEQYEIEAVHIAQFLDPRYKSLNNEDAAIKIKILNHIQNMLDSEETMESSTQENDNSATSSALEYLFQVDNFITSWQQQYELYKAKADLGLHLDPVE